MTSFVCLAMSLGNTHIRFKLFKYQDFGSLNRRSEYMILYEDAHFERRGTVWFRRITRGGHIAIAQQGTWSWHEDENDRNNCWFTLRQWACAPDAGIRRHDEVFHFRGLCCGYSVYLSQRAGIMFLGSFDLICNRSLEEGET